MRHTCCPWCLTCCYSHAPPSPLGTFALTPPCSYLGFGQKATRAALLSQASETGVSPCVPAGYSGTYEYNGANYSMEALPGGPSALSCAAAVLNVLKTYKPCGTAEQECTFDGIWGGARKPSNVVLMSSFWWTALDGGRPAGMPGEREGLPFASALACQHGAAEAALAAWSCCDNAVSATGRTLFLSLGR